MTRARLDAGRFLSAAVLCLALLLPTATHAAENEREVAHPTWFKTSFLDLRTDLDEARRAGKAGIVVFFHTPSRSDCKALLRTTFADPDVATRLITPAGERTSARDWADALGLLHAPALVYFDECGREVLRIDSDLLVDAYGAALKASHPKYIDNVAARFRYVETKGYLAHPQFQQWRQRQARVAVP